MQLSTDYIKQHFARFANRSSYLYNIYRYTQLKQQFDLKANEAEMVKSRLEQGSHHQQLEDITALQTSIGNWTAKIMWAGKRIIAYPDILLLSLFHSFFSRIRKEFVFG